MLWKIRIGGGLTKVWKKIPKWYGTGWPGQPVLVEENGRLYVLFGGLDYNLWKVDAATGKIIWKHKFKNVIKCTPTVFINPKAKNAREKGIILCGSRRDFDENMSSVKTRNFKAISLLTGEELWFWGVPQTQSYSRDLDATGLVLDDVLYLGAENGIFYFIDPLNFNKENKKLEMKVLNKFKLYTKDDVVKHKSNLCIESYPALLENTLYITAGSGHVYGINVSTKQIQWDFYIGSDLDSTPVITKSGDILFGVEKQYIEGKGGVFMLDPKKPPQEAVVWYFPVENKKVQSWEGGVIGSVAINDEYIDYNKAPHLAAFCSLDGYTYIVSQEILAKEKVFGPNNDKQYPTPKLIWKEKTGASISTPLFIDNNLIVCGYEGKVSIFNIDYTPKLDESLVSTSTPKYTIGFSSSDSRNNASSINIKIKEQKGIYLPGSIESTPIVWDRKIYVGCKDGYFYCLGESSLVKNKVK